MPLTKKGKKIKKAMVKTYGAKKGKQVFYASENKGIIKGIKKGKSKGNKSEMKMAKGMMEHEKELMKMKKMRKMKMA